MDGVNQVWVKCEQEKLLVGVSKIPERTEENNKQSAPGSDLRDAQTAWHKFSPSKPSFGPSTTIR